MERSFVKELEDRLKGPQPLIQVLLGPRQVGKTTGIEQLLQRYKSPYHYATADESLGGTADWLSEQWQAALLKGPETLLVIDEIQKIHDWSATIKRHWDAAKKKHPLKCVLLGSSSLSLQTGLTESLTGRFETLPVFHWSYVESHEAFGYDLTTFLTYGGYPGANPFIHDYGRWYAYMKDAIVDTVIGKDILSLRTVAKPALFRQAFAVLCSYPAKEVSYNKLLGQLQEKGNSELVKHYIELYEGAFLFTSLFKYSGSAIRTRTSSPKLVPRCPALFTLAEGSDAIKKSENFGFVFEAAVGVELLKISDASVTYWREGVYEVDFVVKRGAKIYAVEVKSGRKKSTKSLLEFRKRHPKAHPVFITLENFPLFARSPRAFLEVVS